MGQFNTYKENIKTFSTEPTGAAGIAINDNFEAIADNFEALHTSTALTVSSSAVTPVFTGYSQNNVAANAGSLSSATLTINSPGGSPTDSTKMVIRIKNTAGSTAMALTLNSIYNVGDTTVNTITAGKFNYFGFLYNSTNSKWDLVAYVENR